MTELWEPTDQHDWRLALRSARSARLEGLANRGDGLLAAFNEAGVLTSSDLHVARRVGALGDDADERVLLALALVVRAVRRGSVCLDLAELDDVLRPLTPELPWPDRADWVAAIEASPLVEAGVLRAEHDLLYLDRYHRLERQVCDDLVARAGQPATELDRARLDATLEAIRGGHFSPEQEAAAVGSAGRWTTVLTGGPGTGKTTTVARMLVLLADQAATRGERLSIALAAPTGKAATRLQEAVSSELADAAAASPAAAEAVYRVGRPVGVTLHRLLGWRPDNATRFRHDRSNRLKYDVVVVDECSMVELTMMGRLLEAVRPDARLILVGDPRQLTSVGAGAVLSDLVAGYEAAAAESPVEALTRNFRTEGRDIQALAEALRTGDAEGVLAALRADTDEVEFVETDQAPEIEAALREECLASAVAVYEAASAGDARAAIDALEDHRLLCAHREGPHGVRHWNQQIERWLATATGVETFRLWYVGRPLLVTRNDYALDVYNGETGVVVRQGDRVRAYINGSEALHDFAPGRLDAVETMHAMTIHKSQGSEANRVTVLLPDPGSRLLTRELFYTAVTRARRRVRVVGAEAAVRAAVATRATRATGLQQRLQAAR